MLENKGANIANKQAKVKTKGVYILAALETKFSVLAFLSVAFSTSSNILLTVESS